ncbi:MAG TPA: tetratricopeptide repeat protein, partial [Bryobacteraceae bacterium]|nr:tetratricopeptide repeat protein [Bryobacteraceae bacterium]
SPPLRSGLAAGKAAERSAGKMAERSAGKMVERSTEKAAERAVGKAAGRGAGEMAVGGAGEMAVGGAVEMAVGGAGETGGGDVPDSATASLGNDALRRALLLAIVLLLAALSLERTLTWRTEETLWADAVAKAPRKVRPRIQLARALDPVRALQLLRETENIAPNDPSVPSEEGRVLMGMGQSGQALVAFGRALALEPNSAAALNNRAAALLQMGQSAAAQQDLERALSKDPCLFDARWNLRRLGVSAPPPPDCHWTREQLTAFEGR